MRQDSEDSANMDDLITDELARNAFGTTLNDVSSFDESAPYEGSLRYVCGTSFLALGFLERRDTHFHIPCDDRQSSLAKTRHSDHTTYVHRDMHYLHSIEAFSWPPTETVDQFVRTFFMKVSPLFPVLKEVIYAPSSTKEVMQRPLLLQSLLFASARVIEFDVLRQLDFRTTREAQNVFYRKAKALFDFDQHTSPIIKIQSAMLLGSQWNVLPETQDPSDWNIKALRAAQAMGLHRS